MPLRILTLTTGLIVVVLLLTSYCKPNMADAQQIDEKIVVYAMPYTFDEYSIFVAQSYAAKQWLAATGIGLYERSSADDNKFAPALAESLPIDFGNGTTFQVNLKSGLLFHDGTSLTAEDVAFTYRLLLTPAVNSANHGFFSTYLNNDSVKAIDSTTVVFNLTQPYAFIESLFSASVMPKARYESRFNAGDYGYNDVTGADANGAGPFVVEEIDLTNMKIVLVKNTKFYIANHPKVNKLIFTFVEEKENAFSQLADGSIDIFDSQYNPGIDEFNEITGVNDILVGDPGHQEMAYNHIHPFFGTGNSTPNGILYPDNSASYARHVRYAMSHAIPRQSIVDEVMDGLGVPATTVMPCAAIGYDHSLVPRNYSITTARTYMEMAGFAYSGEHVDADGNGIIDTPFFEVTLMAPIGNANRELWTSLIGDELPKIGIGVTQIVVDSWGFCTPRTFRYPDEAPVPLYDDGGFDIFFFGFGQDLDWNPFGAFDSTSLRPHGGNLYNWQDPVWDSLVEDYLGELDIASRISIGYDLQAYLYEHEITSVIVYSLSYWAFNEQLLGYSPLLFSVSAPEWHLLDTTTSQTTDAADTDGGFLNAATLSAQLSILSLAALLLTARRRRWFNLN